MSFIYSLLCALQNVVEYVNLFCPSYNPEAHRRVIRNVQYLLKIKKLRFHSDPLRCLADQPLHLPATKCLLSHFEFQYYQSRFSAIENSILSWPVGLSWLEHHPITKRSLVQFLVRAHVWVVGSTLSRGTCERQSTDVSLSH